MIGSKLVKISNLLTIATFGLLTACSADVTQPSDIAGRWECDTYNLDLTDDGSFVLVGQSGTGIPQKGKFTIKADIASGVAEFSIDKPMYPLTEFKYLHNKPVSPYLTSMSGLMFYKHANSKDEFLQCRKGHV
jgi:hypothetical protein